MKFDGLIEYIDTLTDRLCIEKYGDFYLCYNIFSNDTNSKSASIWRDDGTFQMHNSTTDDGRTRYALVEWIKELGYVDVYVKWICKRENITKERMCFFDYVIKKSFDKMNRNEKMAFMDFKKIFCKKYFLKPSTLIDRKESSKFITLESFKPKQKAKNSSIEITPPIDSHIGLIEKYMIYRGLEESDICYPVTVHINNFIKKGGVCFEYPNGFRKIRYIGYEKGGRYFDVNKKFKFLANSENGKYEELYIVKNNLSDIAIVCEGETEGHTISNYIQDYDIYTSHNAVAMADESRTLSKYSKIIVFLDLDRYEDIKVGVKNSISKTATTSNIFVLPKFNKKLQAQICDKFEIENTDFNDLFTRNKDMLEKILKVYSKKIDTL